jgi:hypothetical protein
MKRLLLILFLIGTLTVFSQESQEGRSSIEALKIGYLTKKLSLTPEEAQRFWPIYNTYAGELRQARSDQRRDKASEIETEEKMLNIRKKYNKEFSSVLSPEKVNTFFRSEKEFSSYVQKELSERRQLRQDLNRDRNSR